MRFLSLASSLMLSTTLLCAQTISTIAGGGPGNGSSALNASVDAPTAVAADAAGNFYYTSQNAVFKVSASGLATKIAGTGLSGLSGDDGPALAATLRFPTGVAVDAAGNVYVADRGNHKIRKIDTKGIITTLAGVGSPGSAGDSGPAYTAQLNSPYGVAIGKDGNLYIADYDNSRIRKVDLATGIITTVAGTGFRSFSGDGGAATDAAINTPYALAFDSTGAMYIADRGNNRIRKVGTDGKISTVAGKNTFSYAGDGGKLEDAVFNFLAGIAVDAQNNIYVSDTGNNRIRKLSTSGATTVVGDGTEGYKGDGGAGTAAQVAQPLGIALDSSGNLLIADRGNSRIRKLSGSNVATVAGNGLTNYGGDGSLGTAGQLNAPYSVAVDGAGNVYVADAGNHRVRRIGADGNISTFAGNGTNGFGGDGAAATGAQLSFPTGVAVDAAGTVFIVDQGNHRVRRVGRDGIISTVAGNGTGGFSGDGGAATSATLNFPFGVTVDGSGNLFIADFYNNRVRRVATSGIITTVAGNGLSGYDGDGGAATSARLKFPTAVALGPDGTLYIADQFNHTIRAVDGKGVITSFAGNGIPGYLGDADYVVNAQLRFPSGVVVDASGNVYIADRANHRVRVVTKDGVINSVTGTGLPAFTGDGGNAVDAAVNNPFGLAVDAKGVVYLADLANNRIRVISPAK